MQVKGILGTEINPLNAELNPIWHFLALLGAHHILHVSRIRVKDVRCLDPRRRGHYALPKRWDTFSH